MSNRDSGPFYFYFVLQSTEDNELFNMNVVAFESIYNLIPKPKQEARKKQIYRSKYDPKAPLTGSTFGLHGTTVTVGKGINELKKVR